MRRHTTLAAVIAKHGLIFTTSGGAQNQQMGQAVFKFDDAEVYQSESDLSDCNEAADGRFFS